MMKGIVPLKMGKVLSIVNRREAIRTAVSISKKGDIILIAGKGHEKYQEIKGVKYPFDDKQVLTESFKQMEK
jgi:UDP-N-acetylmuramoyl-L-alanyl-D-glutamate--2,6-diaminopimelate ligase